MADAGDNIIATVLISLGLLLGVGAVAFQILLWLALLLVMVAGALMVRGDLGANGYVGWTLILAAPVVFILPGFMPAMALVLPIGLAVLIVLAGVVKFTGIW